MLVFTPADESASGFGDFVTDLRRKGAYVLVAEPGEKIPGRLPALAARSSRCRRDLSDPKFLRVPGHLAAQRGADIERPRHLQKVTRHPMSGSVTAVAARRVFDGIAIHPDAAVLIDGDRIGAVVPRDNVASTNSGSRIAGQRLARAGFHRHPGQWRRRRAVERRADARSHARDRRRAPQIRNDRAVADADQR